MDCPMVKLSIKRNIILILGWKNDFQSSFMLRTFHPGWLRALSILIKIFHVMNQSLDNFWTSFHMNLTYIFDQSRTYSTLLTFYIKVLIFLFSQLSYFIFFIYLIENNRKTKYLVLGHGLSITMHSI